MESIIIMSHQHLAAVWSVLQLRPDIGHILRELIGQHALDTSLCGTDSHRLRSVSFQSVVSLKTIFDLQRTYLQSSNPTFESMSALLQHDLLFLAIIHLLGIKAESFSYRRGLPDHEKYCSFLGQALLSGLRALLLQRQSLSSEEHKILIDRFDEVWKDEHLDSVDHFVIKWLCRQIIQELSKNLEDSMYAKPACGIVNLPDFSDKLYPVEIHENSFANAAQVATCVSSISSDWFHNALIIYDIYWSTVAALIQLCVDSQNRQEVYEWTLPDDTLRLKALSLILTTRLELLSQIYSHDYPHSPSRDDQWPGEQMRSLLLLGIHPSCSQDQCLCFNDDRATIQSLHLTHGGQELPTCVKKYLLAAQYLDESQSALKQLQLTLEERASALLDCNGELKDLSHKLEEYLQDWYPSAYPVSYESKGISIKDEFYVIGCPELHPLPAKDILDGILSGCVNVERQTLPFTNPHLIANASREPIQGEVPHLIGANFRCPKCTGDLPVISKRKIEPLSKIASQIEQRLQLWQQIMQKKVESQKVTSTRATLGLEPKQQGVAHSTYSSPPLSATDTISPQFRQMHSEDFPEVAVEHVSPTSPRPFSDISVHSGLGSSRFDPPQKEHAWQSLFKSNRSISTFVSIPSYTFFTSGKNLLLWNERGSGYYDLRDADSISFRRINSCNVHIAAGGTDICAIVVRNETGHTLSVFHGSCNEPISQWQIETPPFAMAVSRSDRYVALKFSRHVQIFDRTSGGSFHHDLPPQNSRSGLNNHLVAFSNNSLSFIASTRYEPEKVISYWSECAKPSKTNIVESRAPFGLVGDNGLSSLVYSSSVSHAAFLTTFTEKGFPVFLGLSGSQPACKLLNDNKNQIGARIHAAALCTGGSNLVLMNQRNEIYWILDAFGTGIEARRVATVKRPCSVKRDVVMGMPTSDEVHVFWIGKGRGKLVTVGKSGGKSKPLDLDIDLSQLAS